MTEIEGKFVYIKVIDASSFELFTDAGLTVAYDNSAFTNFVSGNIGLRYQTKFQQDVSQAVVWDGGAGGAEPNGASAINTNINLIQTIIAMASKPVQTLRLVTDTQYHLLTAQQVS